MFLNIDDKECASLAIIDDSGCELTYGELVTHINRIKSVLPLRE